MLVAMFTEAVGRITSLMATASTTTKRAQDTRAGGCKISSTAKGKRPGKKVHPTKETMSLVKRKAKASTPGQMGPHMKETGLTTKLRVSAPIYGKMVASATESGSTTTCLDMVSSSIQMASATRVNSCWTRKRASVSTSGLTEEITKVGGTRVNSTE